jgi:hypothetical protein
MVNTETNICENVCLWDGNPTTWAPPANYLMLVQADTPAKNWVADSSEPPVYTLEVSGVGNIGYTWDGTYLTTNEPNPGV